MVRQSEWQPEIVTLTTDHLTWVKSGDKVRIGPAVEDSPLASERGWGALVPLYSEAFGDQPVAYIHEISFADYFAEDVVRVAVGPPWIKGDHVTDRPGYNQ